MEYQAADERVLLAALAPWAHRPDFDDILQEGRIRAYLAIERAAADLGRGGLVWRAARRAAIDWVRSRQAWRPQPRGEMPWPEMVPLDDLRHAPAPDFAADLIQRVGEIGPVMGIIRRCATARQWQYVRLHYYEGLSQGEVAVTLGVSVNAVQSALAWLRNRVREELGLPVSGPCRAADREQYRRRPPRHAARKRHPSSVTHCPPLPQ